MPRVVPSNRTVITNTDVSNFCDCGVDNNDPLFETFKKCSGGWTVHLSHESADPTAGIHCSDGFIYFLSPMGRNGRRKAYWKLPKVVKEKLSPMLLAHLEYLVQYTRHNLERALPQTDRVYCITGPRKRYIIYARDQDPVEIPEKSAQALVNRLAGHPRPEKPNGFVVYDIIKNPNGSTYKICGPDKCDNGIIEVSQYQADLLLNCLGFRKGDGKKLVQPKPKAKPTGSRKLTAIEKISAFYNIQVRYPPYPPAYDFVSRKSSEDGCIDLSLTSTQYWALVQFFSTDPIELTEQEKLGLGLITCEKVEVVVLERNPAYQKLKLEINSTDFSCSDNSVEVNEIQALAAVILSGVSFRAVINSELLSDVGSSLLIQWWKESQQTDKPIDIPYMDDLLQKSNLEIMKPLSNAGGSNADTSKLPVIDYKLVTLCADPKVLALQKVEDGVQEVEFDEIVALAVQDYLIGPQNQEMPQQGFTVDLKRTYPLTLEVKTYSCMGCISSVKTFNLNHLLAFVTPTVKSRGEIIELISKKTGRRIPVNQMETSTTQVEQVQKTETPVVKKGVSITEDQPAPSPVQQPEVQVSGGDKMENKNTEVQTSSQFGKWIFTVDEKYPVFFSLESRDNPELQPTILSRNMLYAIGGDAQESQGATVQEHLPIFVRLTSTGGYSTIITEAQRKAVVDFLASGGVQSATGPYVIKPIEPRVRHQSMTFTIVDTEKSDSDPGKTTKLSDVQVLALREYLQTGTPPYLVSVDKTLPNIIYLRCDQESNSEKFAIDRDMADALMNFCARFMGPYPEACCGECGNRHCADMPDNDNSRVYSFQEPQWAILKSVNKNKIHLMCECGVCLMDTKFTNGYEIHRSRMSGRFYFLNREIVKGDFKYQPHWFSETSDPFRCNFVPSDVVLMYRLWRKYRAGLEYPWKYRKTYLPTHCPALMPKDPPPSNGRAEIMVNILYTSESVARFLARRFKVEDAPQWFPENVHPNGPSKAPKWFKAGPIDRSEYEEEEALRDAKEEEQEPEMSPDREESELELDEPRKLATTTQVSNKKVTSEAINLANEEDLPAWPESPKLGNKENVDAAMRRTKGFFPNRLTVMTSTYPHLLCGEAQGDNGPNVYEKMGNCGGCQ